MKKIIFASLLIFSVQYLLKAESNSTTEWKFTGYGVIIPYYDGRDFLNETHPIFYTTMKLRVGIEREIGNLQFKMNIQNSRVLGEEAAIVSAKNSVFIIEGFMKYDSILNIPLSFQAGRFQMDYSTGRYISVSPWNYIERTFDGFRFSYNKPNLFLDIFAVKHTSQYIPPPVNATPNAFPYPEKSYTDYDILGFWYQNLMGDKRQVTGSHESNIFTYWEIDSKKLDSINLNLDRLTSGFNYRWSVKDFEAFLEFAYQYGKKGAKEVSAFNGCIELNYVYNKFKFLLGTEIYSGTNPNETSKLNTFDNYLAAKHRFLGLMDYFANVRNGYGLLGVNDFYLGIDYKLHKDWSINLTNHYFTSNKENASGKYAYGLEFDLSLRYNLAKGIFIEYFNGIFLPDELMKEFYKVGNKDRTDPGFATWLRFSTKI